MLRRSVAAIDKQARRVARFDRRLSDPLGRQLVVEVREAHEKPGHIFNDERVVVVSDGVDEYLAHTGDIRAHHREDLLHRHWFVPVDAGVVVGDERDGGVPHPELGGEHRFRDIPSC